MKRIRLFTKFKKMMTQKTRKMVYTEPLIPMQYPITPARMVPATIPRPGYMLGKNESFEMGDKKGNSMITDPQDLINFKKACKISAEALRRACESVQPGVTTEDVDRVVHDYIISQNAYPSPIGYMGFPKSVCISVNEVCCHGIPNARKLQRGDFLNIDVTAYFNGFHGDTSAMVTVGDVHEDIQKLIVATRLAMYKAINICKPGEKIKTIGEVIEQFVHDQGYESCKEFCGHGVGRELHLAPLVSHSKNNSSEIMEPGMAFTIEPIVLMHPYDNLYMWEDNWTVVAPSNPSAQWEHTIYITETGHEILTFRDNEEKPLI